MLPLVGLLVVALGQAPVTNQSVDLDFEKSVRTGWLYHFSCEPVRLEPDADGLLPQPPPCRPARGPCGRFLALAPMRWDFNAQLRQSVNETR